MFLFCFTLLCSAAYLFYIFFYQNYANTITESGTSNYPLVMIIKGKFKIIQIWIVAKNKQIADFISNQVIVLDLVIKMWLNKPRKNICIKWVHHQRSQLIIRILIASYCDRINGIDP